MYLVTIVLFLQVLYIDCSKYLSIPYLKISPSKIIEINSRRTGNTGDQKFINIENLMGNGSDSNDFWLKTELLGRLRILEQDIDVRRCDATHFVFKPPPFPSNRLVQPICKSRHDSVMCPHCAYFPNETECELFQESCKERRVKPWEYGTYCDKKYGKWRTLFVPADHTQCRCCDECIYYRELDQSCVQDEFQFDIDETLPVTSVDFRAGCNPYLGHPYHELKSLRCDQNLRRCVPVAQHLLQKDAPEKEFRFKSIADPDCRVSCFTYRCPPPLVPESKCTPGAFVPNKDECNCCGQCSQYLQVNQQCSVAARKYWINGKEEMEVEEEMYEPGCDDGLVCRQGICQDIHKYPSEEQTRRRGKQQEPFEPCKDEMKLFKKKYGIDGHLHYNAPQCTPLWLYAPIQCRRFVCHCAMEDGTIIGGTKAPRVEAPNMNCDCARERCRGSDIQCDNYGNYKQALFSWEGAHSWPHYLSQVSAFYASFTNEASSATTSRLSPEQDKSADPPEYFESIDPSLMRPMMDKQNNISR